MDGPNGTLIDKELSDIISKKSLLDYSGFKDYMKAVLEFYNYKNLQIAELTKVPITKDSLDLLNLVIAERNALDSLLMIEKEFKDSVTPSEETLNPYEDKYNEQ